MKRLIAFSSLLLLVASSAFAQDVRYNFDKSANFAGFKTYKWVVIKGANQLSDLPDRQVKAAVDAELAKKARQRTCLSATRPASVRRSSTRRSTPGGAMVRAGTGPAGTAAAAA
jgi:hypothetical protein